LIKYFSDFLYVDPFRRYLRSESKVVKNRAEFWTFFTLPNFVGVPLLKLVYMLSPHHVVKYRVVTSTIPKVIGAHMWNFKPNFEYSPLKFSGGGPSTQFVVCTSKHWPVSSACKNFTGQRPLGAEI